jgi:hypothetical protein
VLAEFDPDEYEPLTDQDAPFIDSIRIQTGRAGAPQREKEPTT